MFLLQGCQRIVEDWQKILMVQSLVVGPHEDMRTWLKYASLCGKSGRLVRASDNLQSIIGLLLHLSVGTTHKRVITRVHSYAKK